MLNEILIMIGGAVGTILTGLIAFFLNRTLRALESAVKDVADQVRIQNGRVRDLEERHRDQERRLTALEHAPPSGRAATA